MMFDLLFITIMVLTLSLPIPIIICRDRHTRPLDKQAFASFSYLILIILVFCISTVSIHVCDYTYETISLPVTIKNNRAILLFDDAEINLNKLGINLDNKLYSFKIKTKSQTFFDLITTEHELIGIYLDNDGKELVSF